MMNAYEASKIAIEYNNGMSTLLAKIKQQAEVGEFALYVVELTGLQKSKLEQLGYKVTNSVMLPYSDISWG